ncbi:hypothetical protein [Halobaculum lipolyticum]|uniref:Uncharacterized protein n=1 Tax=Halobaculum lipolyticum TaxID=3032001 RepID=A0ABD5WC73_9EURY|nr:hypothetical protein [Halobaculum sp. DT31]
MTGTAGRGRGVVGATPDQVRVVDPGTIERTETGKVQRVFDHR